MRPQVLTISALKKAALLIAVGMILTGCFKSSEERAAEHYERGLALVAAGDLDRATVEFRNTLKFNETNTEARRQMAHIFLAKGARGAAYRNYLAVAEQNPDDLPSRTMLSELAFELGNWKEFTRHAPKAAELVKAGGAEAEAFKPRTDATDLAMSYREAVLGDDISAQEALILEAEKQIETNPDSSILRRILIAGYVTQARYEKALVYIDDAITADPENIDNYNAKLEIFVRQENAEGVETELRRIIEQFPENTETKGTLLRFLTSRGQTDKAEEFLRQILAESTDENRAAAYADLIAFLLRLRGPDAALAELDQALEKEATDYLRMMRASLKFDTGEREVALSELQSIVENDATTLSETEKQEAKVLLARMLLSNGNEVGARKLIDEILAEDTTAVAALKMQAQWQIESDDTDGAIDGLRLALESAPEDAEAMTLMAQAYQRSGNSDLMLNFLSLAVEATNNAPEESQRYARALLEQDKDLQAENVLISSLRIAPGNVDVLTQLGQTYLKLEDAGRAQQVVETLQGIDTEQAQSNAEALNIELVAQQQGPDQAIGLLEGLAAREDDTGARAKLLVIQAKIRSGDTEDVLSYAQGLVDEDPDNLRYRYALALTNAALRNYDVAKDQLESLLEDAPTVVQAWLQLVRLETFGGNFDAARATLEKGLVAVPNAPDLLWAQASLLQREGDIDGAIEIFETLYEENSNSLIVANNLASLLATYRGDEQSVERAARIARRLTGTDVPAFQDTYGWIKHLNGDSEEAIAYLEPAAAILTRDVSVQFHLGMAYAALDRRDDAIVQLRKALEIGGPLSGNDALLEQARAKIAEFESVEQ